MRWQSGLPFAGSGQKVGLYGGSFDPPHVGHLHVANIAKKRLGLDHIWFLISPGNPNKAHKPFYSEYERAKALATLIGSSPSMHVVMFECERKLHYSSKSFRAIKQLMPHLNLVAILGADNLLTFDRWYQWLDISQQLPLAFVDRPGFGLHSLSAKLATRFARQRLKGGQVKSLPYKPAPAWAFLTDRKLPHSSCSLRSIANSL